jgi:hypothetical protein
MRRYAFTAIGVIALLYVVMTAALLGNEGSLVYAEQWSHDQLDTSLANGWRRVRVPVEGERWSDGIAAEPNGAPRATVLYLHGNAASIWSGQVRDKLVQYQRLGYRVLAVDYRGYGFTPGSPSERGLVDDGLAAARFTEDSLGVPPGSLVIHGMSLGSGVASAIAVARPPRLLILDGAFTSLPDVAAEAYPMIPARWLMRNRFPTLARLDSLQSPILIVHAMNDEVIPFHFGERLARATHTPTWFLPTHGGHVAGAFGDPARFGAVLESILTSPDARSWGFWGP